MRCLDGDLWQLRSRGLLYEQVKGAKRGAKDAERAEFPVIAEHLKGVHITGGST